MKGHTVVEFANGLCAIPNMDTFIIETTKELFKTKEEYLPIGRYRSYRIINREEGTFWIEIFYNNNVYRVKSIECKYKGNL